MEPGEDELIAQLQQGKPVRAMSGNEDPLRFAIRRLMPRLLRALLDAGASPNEREGGDEPLLHEVVQQWQTGRHGWAAEAVPAMLGSLIAAGADVHARGANDFTALHLAASCASAGVCQQLLSAGADPTAVAEPYDSEGGRTPYELAESQGRHIHAELIRAGIPADRLQSRRAEKDRARLRYRESLRQRRGG